MRSGLLILYGTSGVGKSFLSGHIHRYLKGSLKLISVDDAIHDKLCGKGFISPLLWNNEHDKEGKVNVVGSFINSFSTFNEFVEKQDIYHSIEEEVVSSVLEQVTLGQLSDGLLDTTGSFCNLNRDKINTLTANFPSLYISPNGSAPREKFLYRYDTKPISFGPDFIKLHSHALKESGNIKNTLEDLFPALLEDREKIYEGLSSKNGSFRVGASTVTKIHQMKGDIIVTQSRR